MRSLFGETHGGNVKRRLGLWTSNEMTQTEV
jgi:hypothetical protein